MKKENQKKKEEEGKIVPFFLFVLSPFLSFGGSLSLCFLFFLFNFSNFNVLGLYIYIYWETKIENRL